VNEEPEVDCDCPLHNPNGLPVTSLRLEAGTRLTLRAEAIIQTNDKAMILAFMAAHGERYEHAPLTTLFLARDWFEGRGCEAVVRPDPEAHLLTRVCTSLRLALRGYLWKRLGMALYRGQETCEDCAARLHAEYVEGTDAK
jgi:hypothetical protein